MLLRQGKTAARTAPSRALREHLLDQQLTRLLIDCSGPPLSTNMNVLDLLFAQQINTLASALEPLRQVVARFLFSVRLKLDRVITLLATCQRFQARQQILLGKQKDMRTPLGITRRKRQDALHLAQSAEATADLARARAALDAARADVDSKSARNADLRRRLLVNGGRR